MIQTRKNNVEAKELIKIGILVVVGFTLYGMSTVLPAILSEGKIINSKELENAKQFASIMAIVSTVGVFAGITTVITGIAVKYPKVKMILKIITGYSLYEKIVDDAVKSNLQDDRTN